MLNPKSQQKTERKKETFYNDVHKFKFKYLYMSQVTDMEACISFQKAEIRNLCTYLFQNSMSK